jgi:small subunit ribosomal protein S5
MSDEVTTNNSVAEPKAVESTQVAPTIASNSDSKVETKPGFSAPRTGAPRVGSHSRNDRHYAPRRDGQGSPTPTTNPDGTPVAPGSRPAFGGNRRTFGANRPGQGGPSTGGRTGGGFGGGFKKRDDRRKKDQSKDQLPEGYEAKVILIRRVTRVVKGGKRMRFSALVVVGDREGKIGYGLKKGADFQDSVAKATKSAQNAMFKINFDQNKSVSFPSDTKHKSCEIFLKPAHSGTGLIAGGFIRPVLELAGIQNIYSKINRSRNKIVGVQCVLKALQKYSVK